jgi:PAS domain-containing protein
MYEVGSMGINMGDLEAFNATKAPILYCDMNEVCRYGNPAFFDWFGKKPEQIVGKIDLRTLLGDSNYLGNDSLIKKALNGAKQSIELLFRLTDGKLREILLTFLPYHVNDRVHGLFLHLTDFTAIKLLTKKETSPEKTPDGIFQSLVENSPMPAWIVDSDSIVYYLNEAYKKLKPQVKVGKPFLESFANDAAKAYQDQNREILASGKTFSAIEKLFDGLPEERVFKYVKFPLLYKNKYMIGGFAVDITANV